MKIAVIIPARGGSKRLHKKNIYPIWGQPMLYWAIKAANELNDNTVHVVDTFVSSEDKEILEIASQFDIIPIKREASLSRDFVYKQQVIRECFNKINTSYKNENYYDLVISLQPNSPQITWEHLNIGIETLIKYNRDEIFSVSSDLMQNAAFRVMKSTYINQKDLSTNCGVVVCDIVDVHTKEDIDKLEQVYI